LTRRQPAFWVFVAHERYVHLMPSTAARLEKRNDDLRHVFAAPLAARLGRTAKEVKASGLELGDFKVDERIELELDDGSSMSLRYAFVVLDTSRRLVGVFTEHCGYFCFPFAGTRVSEFRGHKLVARHDFVEKRKVARALRTRS
jgi:hypothetical protein